MITDDTKIQKDRYIKITIIIPIYNVSAYIERCIKSVMNQTYNHIECILVDDCGTDDSIAIAKQLLASYVGPINFLILHHKQNMGLSAARNTGTKNATGEYIFYLDSDDELAPDCIEKLSKPVIIDKTIEMVAGSFERYTYPQHSSKLQMQGIYMSEQDIVSSEGIKELFFGKKILSRAAWNKLIKKEFLIQNHLYFKEGLIHEDLLWTCYLVRSLMHLYTISDVTYFYYKRPYSITTGTNKHEMGQHYKIIIEEIAHNFLTSASRTEVKYYTRLLCQCYLYYSNFYLSNQSLKLFEKFLSEKNCISLLFILETIVYLSKTKWGRNLLHLSIMTRSNLNNSICNFCCKHD